ncbi:MAG: phosphoenolpyruvate carboxylase, partial [Frankiaceae bacterium]|nr:phosphoenolpyruvate carboxylase [Frankiaceae bacterium]
ALREQGQAAGPVRGSLAAAVADLVAADGEAAVAELVTRLRVQPVLTAHPTEARRRATVSAIVRSGEQLDRFDDPRAAASELADARRRLLEEVSILWRTAQLRSTRPSPLDEVRTAMSVFDETLVRVVPKLYRTLDGALGGPDSGTRPAVVPSFLRWGSWVGGDRDGNPHVTAEITRQALAIQSDHALAALATIAARIGRTLTADVQTTPPSALLRAALAADVAAYPDLMDDIVTRSPSEPHRQKLLLVAARLAATRRAGSPAAYRGGAAELLADLHVLQDSLAAADAPRLAYGELQHLIWQVETFGFHLAELEIRQHSHVHTAALTELVGAAVAADAAALDRLSMSGAGDAGAGAAGEMTREVLATLEVMRELQSRFGVTACQRYVVSFTRAAKDLAAVRALARIAVPDGSLEIDVVPLFETRDDLTRAVSVLDEYAALPGVQRWLTSRDRRMEVMLGYSDSAKDVGPASATLALYDAQSELTQWARRGGIVLTLFHGRGGALGRGGGPAHRAVRSQAPGSVAGRFKLTEQGEVVFARYGTREIAARHLEQVTAAVLIASTPAEEQRTARIAERFAAVAARLEAAARTAYRGLVEQPGFAQYVGLVSPLEELGELAIGSRPARRGAATGLADLRAIPWVFAWAQTRCNLPGWYGLGTGLAAVAAEPGGMEQLQAAYADWPLFTSMLDNAEMSLAKADRQIAARYLALGDRPDLTDAILAELDRTIELVLAVTGHERLLDKHGVLARAVDLRNPYVDALSHLQLRALGALRSGHPDEAAADRLRHLLLLTVNGVAAGLQNTG